MDGENLRPGEFRFQADAATRHGFITINCPCGCGSEFSVPVYPENQFAKTPKGYGWGWDGNLEKPTLTPSIKRTAGCGYHGVLTAGKWTASADGPPNAASGTLPAARAPDVTSAPPLLGDWDGGESPDWARGHPLLDPEAKALAEKPVEEPALEPPHPAEVANVGHIAARAVPEFAHPEVDEEAPPASVYALASQLMQKPAAGLTPVGPTPYASVIAWLERAGHELLCLKSHKGTEHVLFAGHAITPEEPPHD